VNEVFRVSTFAEFFINDHHKVSPFLLCYNLDQFIKLDLRKPLRFSAWGGSRSSFWGKMGEGVSLAS
jgi:hypothetical protein